MTVLVTGGAGFIGSHLVRRMVAEGEDVVVLDDLSRGRLEGAGGAKLIHGDVRNLATVAGAVRENNVDEIIHLAYVNGTKTFYSDPDLVLDVAVKGITAIIDVCRNYGPKRLTLASSSEVCRAKLVMPDETIPLVIPDPFNPRYSYSAGKIISEMMAIHSKIFNRLLIFRPFNVYGPGMSPGHVVPDFMERLRTINGNHVSFEILGSGEETRSFCYIDDLIDGVMLMRRHGEHNGIYNIGRPEEITIADLAYKMARIWDRSIEVSSGNRLREGDAVRRVPDISKMVALGYDPKISLDEGLRRMMS